MVIHGTLHSLRHDYIEVEEMEVLEGRLLASLDYLSPYDE